MELNSRNIGKRVKFLRIDKKMTQEKLAEQSNRHFTYIGRIERGEKNVSVQALGDILCALEVTFGDFFRPFEIVEPNLREDDIYSDIVVPLLMLSEKEQDRMKKIFKLILEDKTSH